MISNTFSRRSLLLGLHVLCVHVSWKCESGERLKMIKCTQYTHDAYTHDTRSKSCHLDWYHTLVARVCKSQCEDFIDFYSSIRAWFIRNTVHSDAGNHFHNFDIFTKVINRDRRWSSGHRLDDISEEVKTSAL